jgi:hypothetical protein
MKEKETSTFKYTQKEMVVGNKKRSIIIIEKKSVAKATPIKRVGTSVATIKRKKCGGCSRNRR